MSPSNGLSIGEVARRTGVAASTLRYYERCGLLPAVPRLHGRRLYDAAIFRRLALVRVGRSMGFTVGELQRLVDRGSTRGIDRRAARDLVARKGREIDARMAALQRARSMLEEFQACACEDLDHCAVLASYVGAPASDRKRSRRGSRS
jgi:MerR family redox-sensitive transcriptional activator SoxR